MALHAAGVSIDKVVRDTKSRQEAIDTYQDEQRKLFGAQWLGRWKKIFRYRLNWRR
jgi:hypothetical protein